jgi:single-strand DNA-binding protein
MQGTMQLLGSRPQNGAPQASQPQQQRPQQSQAPRSEKPPVQQHSQQGAPRDFESFDDDIPFMKIPYLSGI